MLYTFEAPDEEAAADETAVDRLLREAAELVRAAHALRARDAPTTTAAWEPFLEFTVPGKPVSKERPYVVGRRGGLTRPQTRQWESMVSWKCLQALQGLGAAVDADHAWRLDLVFHVPDRRARDVDNMGKLVMDALEGVVWKNDSQVRELHAVKSLDRAEPRTQIGLHRAP